MSDKINPDRFSKSVGECYLFSAYQICLSVGATSGRPRAFDERPYKPISAEILFSLPICVIMGLHRRAGACSRRNERLESKKAAGVNPRPTKGYGLCPVPL